MFHQTHDAYDCFLCDFVTSSPDFFLFCTDKNPNLLRQLVTFLNFQSSCPVSSAHCNLMQIPNPHLEQVDDPGGFPSTSSNRLQDEAAWHHLPSDGVHAGTRQRLLKHGLHGQHAHTGLREMLKMSPNLCKQQLQPRAPAAPACFYLSGLGAEAAEVPRLAEVAAGRIC